MVVQGLREASHMTWRAIVPDLSGPVSKLLRDKRVSCALVSFDVNQIGSRRDRGALPCGIHRNELYYATAFSIAEKADNSYSTPLSHK